jgi:hypothetical protein
MRRRPVLAARAGSTQPESPSALLGPDHPLARATEALQSAVRQAVAVAAVLTGSIINLGEGRHWATTLAASAAAVLLAVAVVIGVFRQRKRDCALALILEGRERVPLAAVRRQRQRLLDQRTRTALAGNLSSIIEQASACRRLPACRIVPLFDRAVITAVADDLWTVSALLRACRAPARGIALTERLLIDARSPLYGNDAEMLRDELHRISLHLNG